MPIVLRQGHRRARPGRFLSRSREKDAIAGGRPCSAPATRTDALAGPPVLPGERNPDGALAVGFVVAGANRVAPPIETNRLGACAG